MSEVIIIPVHNQLPHLQVCLESVYAKSNNPKVIIVDDGSTCDLTKQWIIDNETKLGYKRIYHDTAMGFSKACNDGIDFANANYDFECLCLLNSDTVIYTDNWFQKVEWYFKNGDKIGIASVMSDSALAQTVRNQPLYLKTIHDKPAVYSYLLHGFCYFISKEMLSKIGKLDEVMFPHYGSEDDYSMRVYSSGYKAVLVGCVFVHHHNNTSYTDNQRHSSQRHSIPDLNRKWGKGLINRCGMQSIKAGLYINTH